MEAIRTATNKAWVLGNDRFKAKVEKILNRQVQQKLRGGQENRACKFNCVTAIGQM
jgi:hypothetical protein